MSNEFEQPVEPMSRTEDLLRTGTEEPVIAMSRIEKILRGEKIKPQSRIEDLLLKYNPSDILIEKSITENGTYYARMDNADGYYKVVVDTPVIPPTVLDHLVETITTNGTHTFTPETGVDGFSDASITVNVQPNTMEKSISANGTYIAANDNVDGYSKAIVNVPPEPITEARSVENLPQPIASFNNGAEAPLTSLKVAIEPVQDLHGYDSPWVGGSGRNLFSVGSRVDGTIADVRYTSDDEYIYLNGTKQGIGYADLSSASNITLDSGTYYIRAFVISGTASNTIELYPYDGTNSLTGNIINNERTLTLSESKTFRFRFAIWTDGTVLTNYKVGIVVSKTSSIDKFYPYSNICPISGWDECNVTVADATTSPTTSNAYKVKFVDGSTPLMVYGGELNVTSGVLTDNNYMIDDFTDIIIAVQSFTSSSRTFRLYVPQARKKNDYIKTNVFKQKSLSDGEPYCIEVGNVVNIYFSLPLSVETASDAKQWLVDNSAQILYELVTPTTYETQPTTINSLKGDNNISANTGNINDLDYIYVNDDVGTLINKSITANGSYCAVTDDNADGYLNIDVNVAGGGNLYKYLWSSDEKICIREGIGEIKWFFKGYITDSGEDPCPQEFEQFIPSGALQGGVILGSAYSTSAATEQVGWIGFYQNKIRVWSMDKRYLITGTFYGIVDALDSSAEQHEVYTDPLDIPDIDISLIEKTITENGTYSAEDDGYVGYSDVTVNVPPVGTVIPTIKLKSTTTITTEVI